MKWEDHIKERLEEHGFFDPSEYVAIFYGEDGVLAQARVDFVATCQNDIRFTTGELETDGTGVAYAVMHNDLPMMRFDTQIRIAKGRRSILKFKRPLS